MREEVKRERVYGEKEKLLHLPRGGEKEGFRRGKDLREEKSDKKISFGCFL